MTLPIHNNPPPRVCRLLRTKTHYGTYTSTDTPWQTGDSNTASFWCLKTMEPAGPDDQYAHPHACLEDRTCFQNPLD